MTKVKAYLDSLLGTNQTIEEPVLIGEGTTFITSKHFL